MFLSKTKIQVGREKLIFNGVNTILSAYEIENDTWIRLTSNLYNTSHTKNDLKKYKEI